MRTILSAVLLLLLLCAASSSSAAEAPKKNKFRDREASDDMLPFPPMDEEALADTKCPKHLELRWQTEVSSSIFATPLIADINSDGKLEVVVPSFVHYLEVLEGSDGDKLPGWPAFHQSTSHSSPLLYDIDKDGQREIALATYNGVINFFRPSGYAIPDKLEVPRRKVRRNWYGGLHPDPADQSLPDAHDGSLVEEATTTSSMSHMNRSTSGLSTSAMTNESNGSSTNASKAADKPKYDSPQADQGDLLSNLSSTMIENTTHTQRRLLEDTGSNGVHVGTSESHDNVDAVTHASNFGNTDVHEEDADSSLDLSDVADFDEEYNDDSEDYADMSMWGDEDWTEEEHEKVEDYVNIDSHIMCTPVIADIDNDDIQEMIVAVSYFFDHTYYNNPEHLADLGGIDIDKYTACGIVVFNLDTKQVKWTADLDLSRHNGSFRAYINSSPTVVDLDGDGNLDILFGTSDGFFYILDHHGEVRDKFPLEMAEIQGPVVAADINDDGKIEIVTADSNGNVAAWTAQGDEIWEVHLKSNVPQGPTVGDVDGDGHTDIVVPTVSGNIYVLSGRDGSLIHPFPYRTHGRVMNQVLLVDLSKHDETMKGLTLVTSSFDGYLYLIDGSTACADVIDIGEISYSMVLADNVDGGDDLDLIVTTMNGNVFCFSTPSPHHPLKTWRSANQGRNNVASRYSREGIFVSGKSRAFCDEEGSHFWVEMMILDKQRVTSGSQGPYNVTVSLLVPGNYQGEKRIVVNRVYDQSGKQRVKLPTVPVRTTGTVLVEMVDKNGLYFSDEFSLTFHMHYYKLLKWLLLMPMLGMFAVVVILRPQEGAPLPSFSRNIE